MRQRAPRTKMLRAPKDIMAVVMTGVTMAAAAVTVTVAVEATAEAAAIDATAHTTCRASRDFGGCLP